MNSTSNKIGKKTLDTQHTNKLNEFQTRVEKLTVLKQQFNVVLEQVKDLEEKKKESSLTPEEIDFIIQLQDERDQLRKTIDSLETIDDEVDYLINTAPILFKYYDILEKGNPDDIANKPKVENTILKWLIKKDDKENKEGGAANPAVIFKEDRAALLERYMSLTEDNFIRPEHQTAETKCVTCGSTNMNILLNDGIIHCNECSCVEYIIVDHDRPSYKDPPKEISYFAYKRINHFNEWLSQIQGKETTEIPEEIYDAILMEIKKQRISNMAELKITKIKDILKKLKFNKYYEHAAHIKHKLNGVPIPHLEPELEEKLRTMFKLIQPPFLKFMPSQRKNFLSYSYCIHKMIQLLGKDEYLPNFPLLKSRDKLHQQDQIWKNICDELGWHFIRSI